MLIANVNPEVLCPGWMVFGFPTQILPGGGLGATFFLKATYRIKEDGTCEPWEKPETPNGDLPVGGDPALGIEYPSDFVPYKPHGEFLVAGHAHPPTSESTGFPIGVRVGDHSKQLVVHGQRNWSASLLGSMPGVPAKAEKVPLSYAHAWGGPEYKVNPIGVGREGSRMPLIELREKPVVAKSDNVQPAGFSPIDAEWPQRRSKLGTYDDEWLRTHWPWFPSDFDWTYFNSAPQSQWLGAYLRGNEELEFINLHPEEPRFIARLPGVRGRCFVTKQLEDEAQFLEVPTVLDTLWVNPDEGKLILVWRGRTPVSHLKLKDILTLMLLVEPLDQPHRSLEEYAALQAKTLSPEEEEAPVEMPDGKAIQAELDAVIDEWKKREEEIRKEVAEAEEGVKGQIRETLQEQQNQVGALAKVPDPFNPEGITPSFPGDLSEMVKSHIDDPRAIGAAAELPEVMDSAAKEAESFDAKFKAAQDEIDASFPDWMKREPPPKEEPVDPAKLDEKGLSNLSLEEYNFAGKDLRGIDFSGATLVDCVFDDADLTGANFHLARLSSCCLNGANLTRVRFESAMIEGCNLDRSNWMEADLTGASITGSNLQDLNFNRIHATRAQFGNCPMAGAVFGEASLISASFNGCDLSDADFSGADLTDTDITGNAARGLKANGANVTRFRAGKGTDLTEAIFDDVKGEASCWQGAILDRASFRRAVMPRAQFSETCCEQAIFDRAEMPLCTFEDAVLPHTFLSNANLRQALFDRADLNHAILDGSNLYDASFWEANLFRARWMGANTARSAISGHR